MDNNTISKLAGIAAEFAVLVRAQTILAGKEAGNYRRRALGQSLDHLTANCSGFYEEGDYSECYALALGAEEALRKIKTDEETKKMDDRRQDAKHWTIGEKELNRANLDRLYTNMVAEKQSCLEKMNRSEGVEWYTQWMQAELITKLLKESGIEP